jgi:hypothetical protein
MNRSEMAVDALADTFVSFEDHAAHKASNLAVLAQLAASPEKRRAEEVLKTPRTQTVKFAASNPPAMGTRAKKLAVLTAHLPTSPKAAAASAASALKPPPARSVLTSPTATKTNPVVTAAAPKGVGTLTPTPSHPKTTSGLIPAPSPIGPASTSPIVATPFGTAPQPASKPTTRTPPKPPGPSANQAQTAVDPLLVNTINSMIKGLYAFRRSQEQLVAGQKQMVDQLINQEAGGLRKVVSPGAVSSLAEDDDISSVPSTVVLDRHGRLPSSQPRR